MDTLTQQYLDTDALAKTLASYTAFEPKNFINFDNVIESPTQTTSSSSSSGSNDGSNRHNSNSSSTSSDSNPSLLLQAAHAPSWNESIGASVGIDACGLVTAIDSVNPWQLSQPAMTTTTTTTALGDSAECIDDLESLDGDGSNTSTSHWSQRAHSLSMSPPHGNKQSDDTTRTSKTSTRRASASDSTTEKSSSTSRKRKQSIEDRLERNRIAATKWRKKKKDNLERLQHDYATIKAENIRLKKSLEAYREEVVDLKLRMIAEHSHHQHHHNNGQSRNPLA